MTTPLAVHWLLSLMRSPLSTVGLNVYTPGFPLRESFLVPLSSNLFSVFSSIKSMI